MNNVDMVEMYRYHLGLVKNGLLSENPYEVIELSKHGLMEFTHSVTDKRARTNIKLAYREINIVRNIIRCGNQVETYTLMIAHIDKADSHLRIARHYL